MIFQQYYLGCLSHASYLIGDGTTGEAVVVDPRRDISDYLRDAGDRGLRVTTVLETHFHADFVSGHLELAAATGAQIAYGAAADADFPIRRLADGERLRLGEVELEVLSTPGHTPESISIVVRERAGDEVPFGVLTGDTLFIGDVGRPDLLASVGVTAEELARSLYRSVHRLLELPDQTRVFPAHGAGSACGKHLSTETESTIGIQRRTNYALAPMSEDEFVALVSEGQPAQPLYFSFDARRNHEARPLLDETATPRALSLDEVLTAQAAGAVVIDTRDARDFAAGHLRGAVNVGIGGRFAEYAGDVARHDDRIVLVGDPGTELEARVRLGRIGFDTVIGYLDDPLRAFVDRPEVVIQSSRVTAGALAEVLASTPGLRVVDVRNSGEIEATGMVPGAESLPLPVLLDRLGGQDREAPTVVYCAGGYRSSIAASALAAAGVHDVSDLVGGFEAWAALQA